MESDDNTLLNVTMNIADPKSMSDKTSKSGETENFGQANIMWSNTVLASQLLSKERGCSFVVMPSELDIPAYSCLVIQVTAYSDMWGVYTDQLVCQVTLHEYFYKSVLCDVIKIVVIFLKRKGIKYSPSIIVCNHI